jgi:ubiquinone/menaquinone biosynthesis C-methylase UbiE
MVEKTLKRLDAQGLRNVQGFLAPAHKLPFDIFDIDLLFLVYVLGEIPDADRLPALREALRVLRPGAVLSISEMMIDPHYRFRSDVVKLCRQAGFELASIEGSLFNYTATFRKPKPREPLGYAPRFE